MTRKHGECLNSKTCIRVKEHIIIYSPQYTPFCLSSSSCHFLKHHEVFFSDCLYLGPCGCLHVLNCLKHLHCHFDFGEDSEVTQSQTLWVIWTRTHSNGVMSHRATFPAIYIIPCGDPHERRLPELLWKVPG